MSAGEANDVPVLLLNQPTQFTQCATKISGNLVPRVLSGDELKMSLPGTGLNKVQCRTPKAIKAGQGYSPPHRKFGKDIARLYRFLLYPEGKLSA